MQTKLLSSPSPAKTQSAFTFVEVIIAMAAVGVVVVALYLGISSGFSIIRLARENLRATQIMVEKMETVRLYNWDQINSNGCIPRAFAKLSLSGNGQFTGAIYAPNADLSLGGGGNEVWDFVGSSVTRSVTLNGHYNFHYDEQLEKSGPI